MQIQTNKPFSVPTTAFGVSAPSTAYKLNYSADGNSWAEYSDSINEVAFIVGVPKSCIYKLVSPVDETLYINY